MVSFIKYLGFSVTLLLPLFTNAQDNYSVLFRDYSEPGFMGWGKSGNLEYEDCLEAVFGSRSFEVTSIKSTGVYVYNRTSCRGTPFITGEFIGRFAVEDFEKVYGTRAYSYKFVDVNSDPNRYYSSTPVAPESTSIDVNPYSSVQSS
ncbi:hypothetical protein AYI68_g3786 [Smittium mucronatum]|uniref:Uncharacterized protein n=1 Tax=Smittium mucronatum TaxID=133383 RepID=A0A1R0GZ30_9FUNG|nr:hypothetical protein AYI68_g3786 [Smittium mucronatum]